MTDPARTRKPTAKRAGHLGLREGHTAWLEPRGLAGSRCDSRSTFGRKWKHRGGVDGWLVPQSSVAPIRELVVPATRA